MGNVLRVGKDVKARRARVKELMGLNLSTLEQDVKLQLIQELIPLGLMHVGELLTQEVRALAGDRSRGMDYLATYDGPSSGARSI